MSTLAVVQARMTSARLPGKVLMDLGGQPVLDWVTHRIRAAQSVDQVVVATTTNPADDPIVRRAATLNLEVFRGSEEDVLARYWGAADRPATAVIVRVTSDCPFIDPTIIDRVVGTLLEEGADYASNTLDPRTFPRGLDVEAFTRQALEQAVHEAVRASWREHVTPFFCLQPDRFALAGVWHERDHSGERWTLDTPEDLSLLRELTRLLGRYDFGWQDVLGQIERNPELRSINGSVRQKALE